MRHHAGFIFAFKLERFQMKWWIGCSGFHYPEWKKVFYPEGLPQKNWFNFYCQHFNTLELNVTFYRFPQVKFLKNWYDKSPADFCFSVKVPRLITHYKKFSDTTRMLSDFYGSVREGLGDKLGPVLFQLPRQIAYSDEWLQRILSSVDKSFINAVEFRHSSWWNRAVYKQMAKHKISFCSTSYPQLPDQLVINSTVIYYRFHGMKKLYRSRYSKTILKEIVAQVIDEKKLKQAFFYFDNTAEGNAIINAKELQRLAKSTS